MSSIKVKKLSPDAIVPLRRSNCCAGYSIFTPKDVTIAPRSRQHLSLNTGISITLPECTYGRLANCSEMFRKKYISVGEDIIDSEHTGEICINLFNNSPVSCRIKKGDCIAQFIVERYETPTIEVEEYQAPAEPEAPTEPV